MASYKVPQDVEADDKLIGPFSFRQFIYLIIVVIAGALAWGLAQLFIPLAILPLPIIIFFGALALPLRKDQPMEIYLAAIVSFYLKPRQRMWQPDGIQSLVQIIAPKTIEYDRTKNLSQGEAEQRLSYLASIVDSGGWATRGVSAPLQNTPMNDDLYFEAQQAPDVLDQATSVGQSFENKLAQADAQRHQQMVQRMTQPAAPVTPQVAVTTPEPAQPATPPVADEPQLTYNPYPNQIHQSVIQPMSQAQPAPSPITATPEPAAQDTPTSETTSEKPLSPDIMNLASNRDLSIETIQREADRITKKEAELSSDEVVISLR